MKAGAVDGAADQSAMSSSSVMRALHATHAASLMRFLMKLTSGDIQLAEDLLQETLLRAWRNVDALPRDDESLRRWLFTVARRVTIDAIRARRARPVEVGAVDVTRMRADDDPAELVVAMQTVRRAMVTLSQDHQAVLIELFFHGRSTAETAIALGIPEGTVKSRTHYAMRQLRTMLGGGED